MKKNNSFSEMLRHENEITKLKIQAEFGMEFNGKNDLNPAIENIWLNQILDYERAMVDNKQITVAELLGHPICKKEKELNDAEITVELHALMELLHQKNIVIDSVAGVEEREMYRFITEELFLTETDSNFPKNMICCFIYEEFHPNHEYDIRRHLDDFINSLVSKDGDYYESMILHGDDESNEIKSQKLKHRLKLFRDAFDEIRNESFNITSIDIKENQADVCFEYKLIVLPPGSRSTQNITGNGRFQMTNQYEYWVIDQIDMKGVV
jgi:hypothetical protein